MRTCQYIKIFFWCLHRQCLQTVSMAKETFKFQINGYSLTGIIITGGNCVHRTHAHVSRY